MSEPRCAGHVLDDDGVLTGCPDPVVAATEATGTHAQDGRPLLIGLCAEHVAAVALSNGAVMTVTLLAPP